MLWIVLQFAGLALLVVGAGTLLAHCADEFAEATRLGRLLVGTVLLAGTTSLPELTVDIAAVRQGHPDLAVGDLLGSSLMNLLILAVLDLTHYARGKMLSRTAAAHALGGLFSIALTALVGVGLLTAAQTADWTGFGLHAVLWLVGLGYLGGVRMVYLDQRVAAETARETAPAPPTDARPWPLWQSALGFLVAGAVVFAAGPRLAHVASELADLTGLGKTFVGTTLVALTTSLPELSSSFAAIRRGAFDLCVGNVFGSNAFNMLVLVPLDLIHEGSLLAAVNPLHALSAFAAIGATSAVLMGQLYHVERRTRGLEPDALMVIAIALGALGLVYYLG